MNLKSIMLNKQNNVVYDFIYISSSKVENMATNMGGSLQGLGVGPGGDYITEYICQNLDNISFMLVKNLHCIYFKYMKMNLF